MSFLVRLRALVDSFDLEVYMHSCYLSDFGLERLLSHTGSAAAQICHCSGGG